MTNECGIILAWSILELTPILFVVSFRSIALNANLLTPDLHVVIRETETKLKWLQNWLKKKKGLTAQLEK